MAAIPSSLLRCPQRLPFPSCSASRVPAPPHAAGLRGLLRRCNRESSERRLFSYRWRPGGDGGLSDDESGEEAGGSGGGGGRRKFDDAVRLFNSREFYDCHDVLEAIWVRASEPERTLVHGILQCAVGFHHLLSQNHRGAMIELGEGLCKLRKMNFATTGPFHQFEQEISAVLDFIYQTQLELAACTDDICLAMDGSERSYQLLGSFAAGRRLYKLERDEDDILYIFFYPNELKVDNPLKVKVPDLQATEEHLKDL